MRGQRLLIGLLLILISVSFPALAEKRVALVIGNGAYVKTATLPNPKNDAAAIADLLRKAAFDVVDVKADLGADAMRRALRDFSVQVLDADMAVVFYAGHGMEMNGVNYLIPVDATIARDVDVEDETISLERVIRTVESARRLQLIILDSCRDNPFVRSMRRTLATRAVRSGHADIDEKALPPNMLIAYAQKAGQTAEDGAGVNSPYTTALLKHLSTPGLDVELALRRVRDEVLQATRNRQEPFKYGSLGGAELPLVPGTAPSAAPSTVWSTAEREWQQYVKDTKDIRILEAFKGKHKGDPLYVRLAEARIEELKKQQKIGIATPSTQPTQSAWVKLCDKIETLAATFDAPPLSLLGNSSGASHICLTRHERLDGNTGEVLVSAAIRQIQGQSKQHFAVTVPKGMQLQPGMRAAVYSKDLWEAAQKNEKIDETKLKPITLAYTLCHPAGCTAETEATPELISELKQNAGLVVLAINVNGQAVGFPVPLTGFEQSYDGSPVDTKQYSEARRALMQRFAKFQEEQKKK